MLNETIAAGLNDPNCAFFVGTFTGSSLSLKYLFIVVIGYLLFKTLDILLEPFVTKIKNKLKGGNDGKA
jgi:hypothetical protein